MTIFFISQPIFLGRLHALMLRRGRKSSGAPGKERPQEN